MGTIKEILIFVYNYFANLINKIESDPDFFLTQGLHDLNNSLARCYNLYLNDVSWSWGWYSLMTLFVLFLIYFATRAYSYKISKFINRYILWIALFVWVCGIIVYIIGIYDKNLNALAVLPRAIISSFKMFVVSHDLARVREFLRGDALYMTLFSLIHFFAAYISFLFVFRLVDYKIKSSLAILQHKILKKSKGKDIHLFWGVNTPSCLLAENINASFSDTIIFIDIDKENDDSTTQKTSLGNITNVITIKNSEIERLDDIKALVDHCYDGPAAINIKEKQSGDVFGALGLNHIGDIVSMGNKVNIYFLSNDEADNIAGALNLQHDKRLLDINENVNIFIHARRDANNEVFDHYTLYNENTNKIQIKVVDSAHLSVMTLKEEDRFLPVNSVKRDRTTGLVESPFTSMVIGFGATGQEAFKFLYEFSTFIGKDLKKTPFKCYAIDEKMNKIEGFIREKMPKIGSDELELIQTPIDSKGFWEQIKATINDLNYICITINNDAEGLSLAVNLFKYALRYRDKSCRPMLKILLRCYNSINEKRMEAVARSLNKSVEGYNVEIHIFGKEQDIYKYDIIVNDKPLDLAKDFHFIYTKSAPVAQGGDKKVLEDKRKQWKHDFKEEGIKELMEGEKKYSRYHAVYDINCRIAQNISNVLHMRTKMILMGFEEERLSERLKLFKGYVESRNINSTVYQNCNQEDAQLLRNMAILEHERWASSHKLMGYTDSNSNDYIQKFHKCITSWDQLEDKYKAYDYNVVDTTIKLKFEELKNGKL